MASIKIYSVVIMAYWVRKIEYTLLRVMNDACSRLF